jgi:mRNA interferase MazF
MITSNPYADLAAIELDRNDFESGSLRMTSYARPGKLFTATEAIIRNESDDCDRIDSVRYSMR